MNILHNITIPRIWLLAFLPLGFTACSDFLYEESDQLIYTDDHQLDSDADTLFTMAGIMNKMQTLADRTILLGEVRGDLVSVTDNASDDLRQLANFAIDNDNRYNQVRDYYAVINNCNFFLAKADTALRNNRNELIFMKEYAAVKTFRAWTYLQLVLNYGTVPFITTPILSQEESEQDFPMYDLQQICLFFINDIAPYKDTETPGYSTIRNTDSKFFYYPVNVLLGDLYLWSGQYKQAAECYYQYISNRNGTNSAYPLTTNAVRFLSNDSKWMTTNNSWSLASFGTTSEIRNTTSELITMIPGDSIPSEGHYSELRNLFNTTEANEYKQSISPSSSLLALSKAQRYCHYNAGNEFVYAPDKLEGNRSGDLRLQAVYTKMENPNITMNGKKVSNYSIISKYSTRNVHLLRRSMVYLRLAEALNRAGFPRFAFQFLKRGVNNNVIANQVIPYYLPEHATWLQSFDFPNTSYVLETTAGLASENTIGLHAHGCGYVANDTTYVLPDDTTITDSIARLNYQIEQVENLIMDEEALEFAFEGHRFYDLMRIALRRGDPAFLAKKVASRNSTPDATLLSRLSTTANWYLKLEE